MAFIGNLLWFVFGGGIIAWLLWLLAAVVFAITVIGIPFAKAAFRISVFAAFPFGLAHFKLAEVSFAPLGKVIVSSDVARAAKARSANDALDKSLAGK